jgi:hypothetical protein
MDLCVLQVGIQSGRPNRPVLKIGQMQSGTMKHVQTKVVFTAFIHYLKACNRKTKKGL